MGSFIDLISTLLEEVTAFPVDRRNAYIKESVGRLCARNAQIHARLVVCRRVTDVIALGRGRVCRGAAACCPNETNHLSPSSLLPQNAMLQKNGGPEKLLVSYVMRPYPELNGRDTFYEAFASSSNSTLYTSRALFVLGPRSSCNHKKRRGTWICDQTPYLLIGNWVQFDWTLGFPHTYTTLGSTNPRTTWASAALNVAYARFNAGRMSTNLKLLEIAQKQRI